MNKRIIRISIPLISLFGLLLISYAYIPLSEDTGDENIEMPYNRILKPAGKLVFFGDSTLENHALDVALSPGGKYLAVEERYSIVILDTKTDTIIAQYSVRDNFRTINTYSGITWYEDRDGQKLVWGTRDYLISVVWDGQKVSNPKIFHFPREGKAKASIPNELVVSGTDTGKELYIVLNGNDQLTKVDMGSSKQSWTMQPGIAPYGLTTVGNKIYVTNWAGNTPDKSTKHVAGVPWNWVDASVDSLTGVVNSGTVSVVNSKTGKLIKQIVTGLHPNDIIASPEGKFVYVANGNDDYISVIETGKDEVVERINVRLMQGNNPYFGDTPNGLAISKDGKTLYVALGMDNAVAVVELGKNASAKGVQEHSKIKGFIPTGAYPGGIALDEEKGKMYVANIEGIGARLTGKKGQAGYDARINDEIVSTAGYFNAHRMLAAVSIIPLPGDEELKAFSQTVRETNRQDRAVIADLLPRKNVKPQPVPERIGEPSVFKHVIYIIKENRTYDQILGDISSGDGEPELCAFGRKVTPNTHKLVKQFVLLDRYEASGKCSSEGHVWTDASIATDTQILKEFGFINDFGFEEYKDIRQKPLMQHFNHGIEICYVTKGRYEWEVNRNRYLLFPGNGFVTCPWERHGSPREVLDLGEIYWLVITPKLFGKDGSFSLGDWSRFTPADNKKIGAVLSNNSKHSLEKAQALKLLFERLTQELEDKEFGYYQRVCNIVEEFLISILRIIEGRENRIVEDRIWFSKFDGMLRENLAHKWTLNEMTSQTNIGITVLTQRVKKNTGYTPANYLIFLRIEQAKRMLKQSDASLTDIALECGFYSSQHFSSTFSKWVGKSPGKYRNSYGSV